MNQHEGELFAATFGAGFVRFACAGSCGDPALDQKTDDEAALIAADLARRAVEAMRRVLKQDEAKPVVQCTGVSAVWCPVHGSCSCSFDRTFNDATCPLHGANTNHGDPS